jgi:hypothetical protein
MKATIDLPDELYRRVKARSALEGRPVREVAVELFEGYVEGGPPAPPSAELASRGLLADGRPAPKWFGLARKHMRKVDDYGMDAIRESIGRGWAQEVAQSEAALPRKSKPSRRASRE